MRALASRRSLLVAAGVLSLAVVALLATPQFFRSSSVFYSRYTALADSKAHLADSSHKDVACSGCHGDRRGTAIREAAYVGDFYAGLFGKKSEPSLMRFERPTREACLACHREDWSMEASRTARVPHPAHPRVASEERDCVKCHKWTAHEEAVMEQHKEMPFSGVCVSYGCHVGTKEPEECGTCHHALEESGEAWKAAHPRVVHQVGANGCLETCHDIGQCRTCHTTGRRPKFEGLATETHLKAIEALHVQETWTRKHGAEALKDQAKCMKCHVSDGECRECHTRRPASHGSTESWIGRHKDVSKDERRCLTCHEKPWCEDCHEQFKEMR